MLSESTIIAPDVEQGCRVGRLVFEVVKREMLYETERGVRFGEYSFGPHQVWSIGIRTADRDGFVLAFRVWVHSIGGGVSSHGYDPNAPIVYFGVTLPKPLNP